jgi:purine-binding chemotaxis protein CheW
MIPTSRGETLAQRARDIARAELASEAQDQLECIVFDLAGEQYAVDIGYVREVHPLTSLTPIPCTPSFVLGIINVRGQLYPVLELKRLLSLPDGGLTNATRAIVIHDDAMEFAIVADAIIGVRAFSAREVAPAPPTLSGMGSDFVRGVAPGRVVILDAAAILAHPGLVVNEEIER